MKKAIIIIIGLPTLLVMILPIPLGFIFEALKTGYIFGQAMFDELNEVIKKYTP